jgi:hypothetical protein
MHFFISVLIFLFILCFYIHLQYQYKTSDDLEIYELDYTTNKQLQEICHLKQPVLFQIDHFQEVESFFKTISLSIVSNKEDVNVKDLRDYYKPNITSVDTISLSFSSAYGLMETDTKGYFFSENNSDFVRERIHDFSKIDDYLASPWIIHKHYDLLFGSKNAHTPLRYHTETGRFLVVSSSNSSNEEKYIRVKMTPWKNRKLLGTKTIKDYENYEFWSSFDIWNHPIKCLEFDVKEGYTLYIPPYWYYSIQFTTPSISVASFTYSTGMNIISNLSNIGLYFLQQNNIKNLGNWKNIKQVYFGSSSSSSLEKTDDFERKVKKDLEEEKDEEKDEVKEMLSVITTTKPQPQQ